MKKRQLWFCKNVHQSDTCQKSVQSRCKYYTKRVYRETRVCRWLLLCTLITQKWSFVALTCSSYFCNIHFKYEVYIHVLIHTCMWHSGTIWWWRSLGHLRLDREFHLLLKRDQYITGREVGMGTFFSSMFWCVPKRSYTWLSLTGCERTRILSNCPIMEK